MARSPDRSTNPRDAAFAEITVERLILQEPDSGNVRAVLETILPPGIEDDDDGPPIPTVRLSLFGAAGRPAIVAEVDAEGHPALYVGNPDRGPCLVLTRRDLAAWFRGNEVLSIGSVDDGGRIAIHDAEGNPLLVLPDDAPDTVERRQSQRPR